MNVHCALDYRVWSLRVHDIQQNVNDFIAAGPKNRSAQNLFCFRVNTDFHEALGFTFFVGPAHPAHWVLRNERLASGLPYFCVGHAAAA
jgi:hypothetical protein